MATDIGAGETILGCPLASFTSLEAACSLTNVPPCATVSSPVYNEACCGSISSFGVSLASCFEVHAPTCLDTSAVQASLTGITGGPDATNPCAAYFGGGGGGGGGSAPSTTAAPAAPSSAAPSSAGGAGGTTPAPSTAAAGGSSAAAGTGSSTAPSATASKSGSQRQHAMGAGLKVYIGVALIGALAVLSL